jgi:hypothetical protein
MDAVPSLVVHEAPEAAAARVARRGMVPTSRALASGELV